MGCRVSYCQDSNELLLTQKGGIYEISTHDTPSTGQSTSFTLDTMDSKNLCPFEKIKRTATWFLSDRPDCTELSSVLDLWSETVTSELEKTVINHEDLTTKIAVDYEMKTFEIIHEVDGIRSFRCIQQFCRKLNSVYMLPVYQEFDKANFEKIEAFLLSLTSLTVSFYLKLGSEIDCGIGVNKPMTCMNLSKFLEGCTELESVMRWYNLINHPIPISFTQSLIKDSKTCRFYIFDGLKSTNYDRGLSIFEFFGAPLDESISQHFRKSSSDELIGGITLDSTRLLKLSIEVKYLNCTDQVGYELALSSTDKKWSALKTQNPDAATILELDSEGYHLYASNVLL